MLLLGVPLPIIPLSLKFYLVLDLVLAFAGSSLVKVYTISISRPEICPHKISVNRLLHHLTKGSIPLLKLPFPGSLKLLVEEVGLIRLAPSVLPGWLFPNFPKVPARLAPCQLIEPNNKSCRPGRAKT